MYSGDIVNIKTPSDVGQIWKVLKCDATTQNKAQLENVDKEMLDFIEQDNLRQEQEN